MQPSSCGRSLFPRACMEHGQQEFLRCWVRQQVFQPDVVISSHSPGHWQLGRWLSRSVQGLSGKGAPVRATLAAGVVAGVPVSGSVLALESRAANEWDKPEAPLGCSIQCWFQKVGAVQQCDPGGRQLSAGQPLQRCQGDASCLCLLRCSQKRAASEEYGFGFSRTKGR